MIKNKSSENLLNLVEKKHLKQIASVKAGDIVKLKCNTLEGNKEKTQFYEGLILYTKNKGLGKSFCLRSIVDGIGVETNFPMHSPKISSIIIKQSFKIKRSKLYFINKMRARAN